MNTAKIELHIHLDGSLNIRWAYERSLSQGVIPPETSFQEYYDLLYGKNFAPRAVSIQKFQLVCDILQTREDLYDAAYELVKTLAGEGILYAEIRFASQQHTARELTQYEALKAVIDGAKQAQNDNPPIRIGIINCLMHKGESASCNHEQNLETVFVTKELLGKGAVGLDLAGYENNCPLKDYAPYFEKARELGIPYTIHAGEMGIASHVKDAVDLGAHRIGHGVNAVNDPAVLEELIVKKIPLEVCVTSNIKSTLNYSSHPVRELIRRGVFVTLNTDNRIFAKTNLFNEHAQLRMIGVTEDELMRCTYNAVDAAFCDDDTKKSLRAELRKDWNL